MTTRPVWCTVCGAHKTGKEGWFQLVENRWTDRLKILRFQQSLATLPGVYNVCCDGHVRELVVHWMTTGELDFPFANTPGAPVRRSALALPDEQAAQAPDLPVATVLGELAVHRESLTRVLQGSPFALSSILEALIAAIRPETAPVLPQPAATWQELEEPALV